MTLTAQQPLNNVTRVSYQALSAVLGGTQSLHTNSYDEAIGLPTDKSATIALRTQQILAEETGVADVVDPLAGSYHVEKLTEMIYTEAYELIQEIDSMGGALAALKNGYQQRRIHDSAWKQMQDIERLDRKVVGVNHAMMDEDIDVEGQVIDSTIADMQQEKMHTLRKLRDEEIVQNALNSITEAAATNANLFPLILHAVRVYCTVGEIMNAMKDVFGTWSAPSGF